MDSDGITNVFRQSETLGKEHECAREVRINLAVSLPEFTMLQVAWQVVWRCAMNMVEQLDEDMDSDDGASKGRVSLTTKHGLQCARFFFSAVRESVFGCGQVCRDLGSNRQVISYSWPPKGIV